MDAKSISSRKRIMIVGGIAFKAFNGHCDTIQTIGDGFQYFINHNGKTTSNARNKKPVPE
jgi:hypothetical protein